MKKYSWRLTTTAALILTGATASPVFAADFEMFGFLDQGMAYLHEELNANMGGPVGQSISKPATIDPDTGHVAQATTKSNLAQGTGNVSTWGIKGREKISDDVDVIFHLESGFLPDTGEIYGGKNQIFEREASVGLESNSYGQLKFGRFPAMTTGSGTTGLFNSRVNPFGAGWGNMTGGWKFSGTLATARYDNMINYRSPKIGGLQFHAQYSFKNNGVNGAGEEGKTTTDRWWALGATYTGEKFFLAAALDSVDYANKSHSDANPSAKPGKDAYKFLIGGHYNFDIFKLYGTFQYMKNSPWIGGYSTKEVAPVLDTGKYQQGFDAWAVSTGVDFKAWGGTVKMSAAYAQAENQNLTKNNDMQRANFGLGYVYPLSKRTSLYCVGGYFWEESDWQKGDINAHEVIMGLMHRW